MKDSICIILAKKNSKGLKNKNIKNFFGKPLIYHTIKPALEAKIFDKVIVSTDSEKIQKMSIKYKAEAPFLRPKKFANFKSSYQDALRHSLDWVKNNYGIYNYVFYTFPTNPLRLKEDFIKPYKILKKNSKVDLVASVSKDMHPIFWSGKIKRGNSLRNFIKPQFCKNRQELPETYHVDGSVFFGKWNVFYNKKNFWKINTKAYIMPQKRSVDIDNIIDFRLAEILKKRI
tara:strand:- start:3975 stop:4664 length:690 start_codon:yes stop_codon:yes gene_type:complete